MISFEEAKHQFSNLELALESVNEGDIFNWVRDIFIQMEEGQVEFYPCRNHLKMRCKESDPEDLNEEYQLQFDSVEGRYLTLIVSEGFHHAPEYQVAWIPGEAKDLNLQSFQKWIKYKIAEYQVNKFLGTFTPLDFLNE